MIRRLDKWMATVGVLFFVAGTIVMVSADAVRAGDFRFRLQVSYISGMQDLADQYEDDIEIVEGGFFDIVEVDTVVVPVGISLSPYYQWDNGLTLGAGVGPFMYLWAEGSEDYTHWQLPLSATIGYTFFPDQPMSPYVRGGPSYHVANGDFHDSSRLGFLVAAGVELLKWDKIALGVEAAYDSAEVKIADLRSGGTKGIKAAEFSIGLFLQFR